MNSSTRILICVCLAFAAGQAGFAQAPPPNPPPLPTAPFTMQQVVEQALAHNPVLLSSLAEPALDEGAGGAGRCPRKIQISSYPAPMSRFRPTIPASPYSYDVGVNRVV